MIFFIGIPALIFVVIFLSLLFGVCRRRRLMMTVPRSPIAVIAMPTPTGPISTPSAPIFSGLALPQDRQLSTISQPQIFHAPTQGNQERVNIEEKFDPPPKYSELFKDIP